MQNRVEVVLSGVGQLSPIVSKAIGGIQSAGRLLTQNVTAPILGAGAAIATIGGNFEAGMNQVRALTGATSKEFEQLNSLAKELGATTQFSATEAASAMSFLGSTGYSKNQTLDSLPSTLALASATTTELGQNYAGLWPRGRGCRVGYQRF